MFQISHDCFGLAFVYLGVFVSTQSCTYYFKTVFLGSFCLMLKPFGGQCFKIVYLSFCFYYHLDIVQCEFFSILSMIMNFVSLL